MSCDQRYPAHKTIKYKSKSSINLHDEQKSDTDSGRSSAHGDKELQSNGRIDTNTGGQLKVTRCTEEKLKILFKSKPSDLRLSERNLVPDEAKASEQCVQPTGRLQVLRRKDAILKRRNMHRRNTIDVNLYDMQKAAAHQQFDYKLNGTTSKSTNCIDKIDAFESDTFPNRIDAMNFNGTSMPGK